MTTEAAHDTEYDFAGKYEETNPIARALVRGFFGGVASLVARAGREASIGSALEVGCGEGFSTGELRGLLPGTARFASLDIERRLVRAARGRNPDAPLLQASVEALPFPDDAFDLVFCMEVLEHVPDPERALRELRRVSGRWLVLTVPREPIWRAMNFARGKYMADLGNTPGHIQHWSRRGFRRFVSQQVHIVSARAPLPWTQVLARVDR